MNRHERRANDVALREQQHNIERRAQRTIIGNNSQGGRMGAAEKRLPTPENLRHDARSAAAQVEEARSKYASQRAAAGFGFAVGDDFLVMFIEALTSWLHVAWGGDVMVQVALVKRDTGQVIYRGTIVPHELGREVCRRIAEQSRDPYIVVPAGERPLDILVILTPAGQAAPQWATTITDSGVLRQLTTLLARDGYKAAPVQATAPAETLH